MVDNNLVNPDIILIVIDSLRYDVIRNIFDNIIKNEYKYNNYITFTSCLAAGTYTWISVPVIMTGLPALLPDYPALKNRSSIAYILRSNNYYTVAHIANPIIGAQGYINDFDMIYHEYNIATKIETGVGKYTGAGLFDPISRSLIAIARYMMHKLKIVGTTWKNYYEILSNATQNFLKLKFSYNKSIFMYIHLMDLHFPAPYNIYTSAMCGILRQRPSLQNRRIISTIKYNYAIMASYVFKEIQRFVNIIKKVSKEYIVIVTSDHGEILGEFGIFGHDGIAIKIGKTGLFRPIFAPQLIQVPLLIYSSYKMKTMKIMNSPKITHYDLFWTIVNEGNYEYYKNNRNIITLYKQLGSHAIEANKYIVWGKGLYGEQYCFVTKEGRVITESHPSYVRLSKKWRLSKKLLWMRFRMSMISKH